MKVLIIAYACEPGKTSEPGVGWNFSKEISKTFDTVVLTRENNKKSIEHSLKDDRSFLYYDLPKIFKTLKKKLPLGTQLYYVCWQWGAYSYARKELKINLQTIDIVHHLTFGTSWIAPPSFMLNKKFIWGPIGGGDFIPAKFLKQMNFKSLMQESLYYVLNKISKYSIFSYLVRKNSSAIVFRTESAKKAFSSTISKVLPIISETASHDLKIKQQKKHSSFVNAVCVGRMTYWKGFIYAVQGFHSFLEKGGIGKLELLGNGPELEKINRYIKENNLDEHIITRGFVNNDVVKDKLEEATVLLHPSFRDGGSWAIMEAMSYGLPVVCLNTSGPKDMVTEKCGLLIDMFSPKQVVKDIGDGLIKLSKESELFTQLSQNAQLRIKTEYSWSKRGEQIKKVYKEVLNEA